MSVNLDADDTVHTIIWGPTKVVDQLRALLADERRSEIERLRLVRRVRSARQRATRRARTDR